VLLFMLAVVGGMFLTARVQAAVTARRGFSAPPEDAA
jgi:hypothetical protein